MSGAAQRKIRYSQKWWVFWHARAGRCARELTASGTESLKAHCKWIKKRIINQRKNSATKQLKCMLFFLCFYLHFLIGERISLKWIRAFLIQGKTTGRPLLPYILAFLLFPCSINLAGVISVLGKLRAVVIARKGLWILLIWCWLAQCFNMLLHTKTY